MNMHKHIHGIIELTESIINFNKDVDMLYKHAGYDKLNKAIRDGSPLAIRKALNNTLRIKDINSSQLRTRAGRAAHKINPIVFKFGQSFNSYQMLRHMITIGFYTTGIYSLLDRTDYDLSDKALKGMELTDAGIVRMRNDLLEPALKGSIAHELNHWYKDSIDNKFLTKQDRLGSYYKLTKQTNKLNKVLKFGHTDINQTDFEIDSQIAAIDQVKRNIGARRFNKLNWYKLVELKPSLLGNMVNHNNEKEYQDVMRRLIKRLSREGLYGKGLGRSIPKYSELKLWARNMQ